jgi:rod shape-determining protein MreC
MVREPPPFFHRGPSPLARLTFFTLAAIVLMIADHRFQALDTLRLSISVIANPLARFAAMPSQALGHLADYFTDQGRLLRENEELRTRLLEQSAAAQEASLLRAEQGQLRELSTAKARYAGGIMGEVLYTARNPFTRKIVIDKGLTHGVLAGMPVIDGAGVVGQVTTVAPFTAEVTLLTEKDQSVPVMLVRNGLRGVAVGSGKDGSIDVPFMPVSADVQGGDVFVTSGIDQTYPAGLLVAQVTSVEKNAARVFAKISAKPAAGVDNHRYVMMLALPASAPPRPDARADDRKAGKDRGKSRRDSAKPRGREAPAEIENAPR